MVEEAAAVTPSNELRFSPPLSTNHPGSPSAQTVCAYFYACRARTSIIRLVTITYIFPLEMCGFTYSPQIEMV